MVEFSSNYEEKQTIATALDPDVGEQAPLRSEKKVSARANFSLPQSSEQHTHHITEDLIMFARTQDQLTREAAAPKGSSFIAWCMQVSGAGGLAYGQASTIGSSKRFAHQGLSFGLGATKPVSLVENLVNRLGNPEDRP